METKKFSLQHADVNNGPLSDDEFKRRMDLLSGSSLIAMIRDYDTPKPVSESAPAPAPVRHEIDDEEWDWLSKIPADMRKKMKRSIARCFGDWYDDTFGSGYGTGELYIIPALKLFLELCPRSGHYDYQKIERELGPAVAWLIIQRLVDVSIVDYGTSPRYGFLTTEGARLKRYVSERSADKLFDIAMSRYDEQENQGGVNPFVSEPLYQ